MKKLSVASLEVLGGDEVCASVSAYLPLEWKHGPDGDDDGIGGKSPEEVDTVFVTAHNVYDNTPGYSDGGSALIEVTSIREMVTDVIENQCNFKDKWITGKKRVSDMRKLAQILRELADDIDKHIK